MLLKTTKMLGLILVSINIPVILNGQQDLETFIPSIPTSPQAEAIMRYGEYHVNHSAGIPDISIPMFEINHMGYTLPLNLQYNPQPLKRGYNFDVFGHGWGLSVSSCVSRSIEFAADESNDFKIDYDKFLDIDHIQFTQERAMDYNFAHDKFQAKLPDGSSFSFVIDNINGVIDYTVSDGRSVKISCDYDYHNINSFTVVDEDGVKYTFADADISSRYGVGRNSSWNISRIDLPCSTEPIIFTYNDSIESMGYPYSDEPTVSISHHYAYSSSRPDYDIFKIMEGRTPLVYSHRMRLLSGIRYGTSLIQLDYSDGSPSVSYKYVNKIRVSDNNNPVKEIDLDMEIKQIQFPNTNPSYNNIAKLKSVTLRGQNPSEPPLIYSCKYSVLPSSFSGMDHWGYANGHNTLLYGLGNFTVFLEYDCGESDISGQQTLSIIGEDPMRLCPYTKIRLGATWDTRQSDSPADHGVLLSLTYPTGGRTEFEFENHRFFTSTNLQGDYILDSKKRIVASGGGFRIKKMTNYNSETTIAGIQRFEYGQTYSEAYQTNNEVITYEDSVNRPDIPTGIGEPVVDPNILAYMECNYHYPINYPLYYMILGLAPDGQRRLFGDPFDAPFRYSDGFDWQCFFSAANFRRLLDGRPSVLYPEVTVYYEDYDNGAGTATSGKTVYKYNIMEQTLFSDGEIFMDTPYFETKNLTCSPRPHRYHKLNEKNDYVYEGNSYRLVRSEKISWATQERTVGDYIYTYPYSYNPEVEIPVFNKTIGEYFEPTSYNIGSSLLDSKKVTTWGVGSGSDGPATEYTERYSYSSSRQLTQKSIFDANGNNISSEAYEYPTTWRETTPAIIRKMVEKNIITPVIHKTVTLGSVASDYKIEFEEFNTGTFPIIMPEKRYELDVNDPTSYILKEQVIRYTAHGNPQEIVAKDGTHTVYLWGYNFRYLIGVIENATYNQVQAALQSQSKSIESLYSAVDPVINDTMLRANPNLSHALVTTFTYRPLVGVTSITDPSGRKMSYEYDSFGRLALIKDDEGNSVESYNYSYKEQRP